MFEKVSEIFASLNGKATPKILITLAIIILVIVVKKIFNSFVSAWQKKIISKMEKKHIPNISSVETKILITRRIVSLGIYFFCFGFFSFAV